MIIIFVENSLLSDFASKFNKYYLISIKNINTVNVKTADILGKKFCGYSHDPNKRFKNS